MFRKFAVATAAVAMLASLPLSGAQANSLRHQNLVLGLLGGAVVGAAIASANQSPAPTYVQPQPVYVEPQPVYVAPPPVVYYAPPPPVVYYAPPPPVYYQPYPHYYRHW